MTFKSFLCEHNINWNLTPSKSWTDTNTGKTHTFTIKKVNINSLHPHESPSKSRVRKIISQIKSKQPIPLISISSDGTILDGHARYSALLTLLGNDCIIPVEVHELLS